MPRMKFTKMQGLGNDYVFVNLHDEQVSHPAALARAVSDRHCGVGSDGLILIGPSDSADVRMEIYNADGSFAQMCGNGIRCVAKYAVERRLVSGPMVRIETDSGVKTAECRIEAGLVRSVRVDMGRPSLAASALPSTIRADRIVNFPLRIDLPEPQASARADVHDVTSAPPLMERKITCVSIGNPHAVVFVDDLDAVALEHVGPLIERAPEFPERINVHFVRVDSRTHVTVRTWERGSGATRACGTGACAVCAAAVVTERTEPVITVTLPGGELEVDWADRDHLHMTGPAVEVFTGDWP